MDQEATGVRKWDARSWLNEVRKSERFVEAEKRRASIARSRVDDPSICDPLSISPGPKNSVSDPMSVVDTAIDAELDLREIVGAAQGEVDDCMRCIAGLHRFGKHDEAYAVQLRVLAKDDRTGKRLSWSQVSSRMIGVSPRQARRYYDMAVDLMESVGPARAKSGDFSPVLAT